MVTLWGLSTDNLKRSPKELEQLFQILSDEFQMLGREQGEGVEGRTVKAVGRMDLLPDGVRRQIEEAERRTASAGPWRLNVAVAYGGRDEIVDAVRRLLHQGDSDGQSLRDLAQRLSPEDLQACLYSADMPEPDLIIRTSGQVRLSGFLLWQSVYSELYFCDALWPMFRKIDFLRAIRSYQARQRRFGQ